jgi:hypothetical protein
MKKNKFLTVLVMGLMGGLGVSSFAVYVWFMPHRDVVSAEPDYQLSSFSFISEYLEDSGASNNKYLSDDGDSKIVVLSGLVASISQNQNGDQVVLMKETGSLVGVAFTFATETNGDATVLKPGQFIAIKGVVRAGPRHDEFLGLYSNGVIEKASIF